MTVWGVIGGTGASLFETGGDTAVLPAADTRWGPPSADALEWQSGEARVVFLPRHGGNGAIPPHRVNYRANIAFLRAAGVRRIIALNAVGGIAAECEAGRLVVPAQLIDYTWGRDHSFYDSESDEQKFIEFTEPYDTNIRRDLISAAARAGVPVVPGGIYGVTQGPRLETAAEVDRLERDGCSIVGMTSMPEAALAREAGLPYACLAMVVNAAAGRGSGGIHADIEAHLEAGMAGCQPGCGELHYVKVKRVTVGAGDAQ